MFNEIREKLAEAEFLLIGIGEEFEIKAAEIEENGGTDACLKRIQCYSQLKELIKDKNYFVITLCMDGIIHKAGLDDNRIVEPCGTYYKLQCSEKCSSDIYEPDDRLKEEIQKLIEGRISEDDIYLPVCPKCGKQLVFNNVLAENYAEEGYLNNWMRYMKWLQSTVNRSVCILELGVGMRFPTIIRWPFEKVTYFNKKAAFFRVHSKLYQIAEEVKDRSVGIQALPMDLLKELSNEL